MKLLVGGILALDNLKTPHASGECIVGGAGVYASIAASSFTQPGLVGPAGSDFPEAVLDVLRDCGVFVYLERGVPSHSKQCVFLHPIV